MLARSVGQDEIEDCSMVSTDDDGEILFHMGNRYLTPIKEIFGATKMSIPSTVDPNGYLSRVSGEGYVYTDDNHIHYFERRRIPGTEEAR